MSERWITRRAAARLLGVNEQAMPRIAETAGIRRKVIPGTFPTYHAGDVARLAAESIKGGTPNPRPRREAASRS